MCCVVNSGLCRTLIPLGGSEVFELLKFVGG